MADVDENSSGLLPIRVNVLSPHLDLKRSYGGIYGGAPY